MSIFRKLLKEIIILLKLARYLKEFKLNVIVGPLCKLTEAIFELIVPLVMAQIIDVGIKNGDSDYIWKNGRRSRSAKTSRR